MLVTTIEQVNKYIPNSTVDNFSFIESFMLVAEQNEIIPLIGIDLYRALESASGSGENEDYLELLPYAERAAVFLGFSQAVHILDVKLTPNGFAIVSDSITAPASKDRVRAFKENVEEAGYDALESMLLYLEENVAKFPEYDLPGSKNHLINNAIEVDSFFNTQRSRRLYLKLEPLIGRTETFDIASEISQDLLDDILVKNSNDELTAPQLKIINDLKACDVYLSISAAITMLASDIKFNKILRHYVIGRSSFTDGQMLEKLKEQFHTMGVQHLMNAKAYILKNVDDFPLYKASDLYLEAESEVGEQFRNTKDNNSFTFGGYGG